MSFFSDRVAIITGGASGIGEALAKDLADRGARVVICDINESGLGRVAGLIDNRGGSVESQVVDVADYSAVKHIIEDVAARHGRLDYIFNNAGIAVAGEVRDVGIEDWRKVIGVNLWGAIHGSIAAYNVMVKQGFGHIVNTASLEGLVAFPGTASYVVSKFGIVGLSNALRIEGAGLGVKASVVCPGYIKTPIFDSVKMVNVDREIIMRGLPDWIGIGPEECARHILKGVSRNKPIIVVTAFARLLCCIHRLSPALALRLLTLSVEQGRKQGLRIEEPEPEEKA